MVATSRLEWNGFQGGYKVLSWGSYSVEILLCKIQQRPDQKQVTSASPSHASTSRSTSIIPAPHLIISMVCHEQNADAVSYACLLHEIVPKVLQPTLSACFISKKTTTSAFN
jgi:hypothetical protein